MERLSRAKWSLLGCLVLVLVFIAASVFVPDGITSATGWVAGQGLAGEMRELVRGGNQTPPGLIEMTVENIQLSEINNQPVVILKEKEKELYLPIWIGFTEANAILVALDGVEVPRPLTPDLVNNIVDKMGASINYVVIGDVQEQTFYATIVLQSGWRRMEIDARPSDAIAIALRIKAPIYATEALMEKAGVPLFLEAEKQQA